MLTFAFPAALGLLAAWGAVAFFYFLRQRFRRQNVSSTFLWRALLRTSDSGARLRWRSLVLLALQALAVAVLVVSVAGLEWINARQARPGTVYLLDTSASMGAREAASGRVRLENAVAAVRADAASLPDHTPTAVFLVSDTTVASSLDALSTVKPGAGSFNEETAAATLSAWVQTQPGTWSAVLVSDGGLTNASLLEKAFDGRLRFLEFATEAPNLGITNLTLAPGSLRATWFNSGTSQTVGVELSHEGAVLQRWQQRLEPGWTTTERALAPGAPPAGRWKLAFSNHNDALAADDAFDSVVVAPPSLRVQAVGSAPFLRAALPGATWTSQGPDVVIAVTDPLPPGESNLITWGPLPTNAPVFWGPAVSGVVNAAPGAPTLNRWVPWSEVHGTGRGLVVGAGVTVLASVGEWPVAAEWEANGYRHLALGVDLWNSNLGLTAVLPLLFKNFVEAASPRAANPWTDELRVGEPVVRGGSPQWRLTGGASDTVHAVRHGGLWTLTATSTGTFPWSDGMASGAFTVHLPASESDTTPRTVPTSVPSQARGAPERTSTTLVPWLALLFLVVLGAEWRLWNGRWNPRTNRVLGLLRGAAAAVALLALVGLSPPLPTQQRSLALLLDVSDSLGPGLIEQERSAALALVAALQPQDTVALVAFAAQPHLVSGWLPRDEARDALSSARLEGTGTGTDLRAALAQGAALLEGVKGARGQYVFTDGRANQGGALAELPASARAWPISVVPLGRPLSGVAVQRLDLPATARPGERVTAHWSGTTDSDQQAQLTLKVDNAVQRQTVALHAGANEGDVSFAAGAPGTRLVEVSVGEARAQGVLTVAGRPAVLLVRSGASPLAAALEAQGLRVVSLEPWQLPSAPVGYLDTTAVVLDNVSAPSLAPASQDALKHWVAGGGGLVVVGGDSSLGRGEYFASPLEELLPVSTDSRRRLQFSRSRLLFVVDHSGSMTEEVGGTTKLRAAVDGVAGSLKVLSPQDEVGLLEFDSEATWLLPFTPLSDHAKIDAALKTFTEGGGTDLTKALEEVLTAFGSPGPVKRHVIVLTDGQTGGEASFFEDFSRRLKAAQVSLTVLGVGKEVNDTLLAKLAHDGDGQFYHVEGDEVPRVLHKETVRVTRDLIQEGSFAALAVGHDPVQDLGAPPPPVKGYLVTKPRPSARLLFEVERDGGRDPLVADTRYGAGRVAVVTADSGARWLAPWVGTPLYNRFWGQLVRSVESASDKGLRVDVDVDASVARIRVEALTEDGALKTGDRLVVDLGDTSATLNETAPGRYETRLALEPGLNVFTVRGEGTSKTAWAWNPQGTELTRGGVDWAALGSLASSTGGLLQPAARPEPPSLRWSWATTDLRGWWLVVALAVFLAELAVRSTSLGQWKLARTEFLAWWAVQARPWSRQRVVVTPRSSSEDQKRTLRAYRALAERHKRSSPSDS